MRNYLTSISIYSILSICMLCVFLEFLRKENLPPILTCLNTRKIVPRDHDWGCGLYPAVSKLLVSHQMTHRRPIGRRCISSTIWMGLGFDRGTLLAFGTWLDLVGWHQLGFWTGFGLWLRMAYAAAIWNGITCFLGVEILDWTSGFPRRITGFLVFSHIFCLFWL